MEESIGMNKYYYVSYYYRVNGISDFLICGILLNRHPLQWVWERQEKDSCLIRKIISWNEISKEEYETYKYKI